jgi:hypothetical protein
MSRSRIVFACAPLVAFGLLCALPYYCVRLSLIRDGHPFARIVPKERLDIFQYVPTDNFRCAGIVFSDSQAIGWVYHPMADFARFAPFSATPTLAVGGSIDPLFDVILLLLFAFRWWWLIAVYVLFGFWVLATRRKHLTMRWSERRTAARPHLR